MMILKALHSIQTAFFFFFLNETLMLVFAELAIFHSI